MENKKTENTSLKLFFKAMLVTFCSIALLLIGYFTAGFFFGNI